MDITQVNMINGSRVFILEHVLDPVVLAHAHALAASFDPANPLWQRAGTSSQHPRWEYAVEHDTFAPVHAAFQCPEHLAQWQHQLAPAGSTQLFCSNISFFIDAPGSPPLLPHVEGSTSWLSQVYIAAFPHSYNGTTVYNDLKQILFQLPYQDNTGWLFDTGATVMHGRAHSVPEGLARFSLMIWYALLPD
jgi:hypothetical protein